MSELRFPRWLAAVGVFGGVMIALILPVVVLMLGDDLSSTAKLVVVTLALIIGACLAGISAIVGITVPTTVAGAAIKITQNGAQLEPTASCCQPTNDEEGADPCCAPEES
jgi:hypothetical protein